VTRRRKSDLPRDALGRLREPGEPDEMAHLRGLAERVTDPSEAFHLGAALFDEGRYFEAYVHFTLAWKLDREGGYRGLAMVAGGLCHVQRENLPGARAVLAKGCEELATTPPPHLDAGALARQVAEVLGAIEQRRPFVVPSLPRR
jgi:predicted metal-dependent hydrolase